MFIRKMMPKLQYCGHLMRRADSLEKTLMLGKIEGRRRGQQKMRWSDGITAPGLSPYLALRSADRHPMPHSPWPRSQPWAAGSPLKPGSGWFSPAARGWFGAFPGAFGLGRSIIALRAGELGASLTSQRHPGKFPQVPGRSRGETRVSRCNPRKTSRVLLQRVLILSSRDAGLLGPPERPHGIPAPSSVWREDPGLLSRPCRKRRPSPRVHPNPCPSSQ